MMLKATTYAAITTANSHQLFFAIPWISARQKNRPINK